MAQISVITQHIGIGKVWTAACLLPILVGGAGWWVYNLQRIYILLNECIWTCEFVRVHLQDIKKTLKFYTWSVFSTDWQESMYIEQIRQLLPHTHRDKCPHLTAPFIPFTPTLTAVYNLVSTTACPLSSGLSDLQCPHCECATVTACCWITVKYYPDDISIVALSSLSLSLLRVWLLPRTNHSSANRASCWRLFAGRPQDTTGVMSHICR